jgi:hypothetical protein
MTTPTAAPTVAPPAAPVVTPLKPSPFTACDGSASGVEQALFEIILPSGSEIRLCWHHATKYRFVDAETMLTYLHRPKTQGSDH